MCKHTKGPWVFDYGRLGIVIFSNDPHDVVAVVNVHCGDEEALANAALIAAAPTLRALLKRIVIEARPHGERTRAISESLFLDAVGALKLTSGGVL